MKKMIIALSMVAVMCATSFGRNSTVATLEDMAANTVAVGNLTSTGTVTAANLLTTTATAAGHWTVASNLTVVGTSQLPIMITSNLTATSLVCTSAHYGKRITIQTNAAVAITLPANGATAGSWIDFAVHGSASDACDPTISTATADTLIGPNDVDLDSVSFGSSNRIGSQLRFWSDGTFWHVQNLGGTTATYND